MQVISVLLDLVDGISSLRIYLPAVSFFFSTSYKSQDLQSKEKRQVVNMSLKEVEKRFPDGIPFLDPIEDMKVEDATFNSLVRKAEALESKIK